MKYLDAAGIRLDAVHAMEEHIDLQKTMNEIMRTKPRLLIVGSGDGTVSTVSGFLAHTNTTLGYIPLGTTNNFGRSLKLPIDIAGAVEVIAGGHVTKVNLGVMDGEYFVNMANFGISMLVAGGVPHTLKQLFGRAAYGIYSLVTILKHRPLRVSVSHDETKASFVTHQFSVANGSRHSGIQIAADAHIDRNKLLAYTLGGKSRFSTLTSAIGLLLSPHLPAAKKGFIQSRAMSIEASRSQRVELDGEIRTKEKRTQFQFVLDQDALRVLVPEDFDDQ